MTDEQRRLLDETEQEISRHRAKYLQATWAGHSGEAEWHETCVDDLLARWDAIRSGRSVPKLVVIS
jgi:hypothetical protein